MKQFPLIFFFSAFSLLCLAQTPFTEQTFRDINERIRTGFGKTFAEEASPEYTFTMANGVVVTYDQMKSFDKTNKLTEWKLSDIKVKQVGKMAVVTGINKHSILYLNTNTEASYNMRFTYTFEYVNDKWMWLTAQHSDIVPKQADEEETIKKLIETERAAYHEGRANDLLKHWKDDPKTFFLAENFTMDNETIKKVVPTALKPTNTIPILSNYRIKINGNMAIADFDQLNTTSNGGKSLEHDLAILEKINGEWKFIGSSIHNTLSKEDDPKEIYKQWVEEYNKNTKAFLLDKCPDDLVGTANGGAFYNNANFKNMKDGQTSNLNAYDMKSFQSGNLAVIMGKYKNIIKQSDGTEKPVNELFTAVMQKRNGKWLYVGHHSTLAKE